MKKTLLVVLDGCGVGALPDAAAYGDVGSNTLLHVIEAENPSLPVLESLGLYALLGLKDDRNVRGAYGKARERSFGKDTTSGHWEMAGHIVEKAFPTFPQGFPQALMDKFIEVSGYGYIGNEVASGTEIMARLGEEHMRTGKLIVYTSADSVFQIAAHEDILPPEKLWQVCEQARAMLTGEWAVGRVIARPFTGQPGNFVRTGNRRDYSVTPDGPTLLTAMKEAGLDVWGIGKIEDIFAHQGLTHSVHSAGNPACHAEMLRTMDEPVNGLVFVNLVDFDSVWGHRRDVAGFAKGLEETDAVLGQIMEKMGEEDMLIVAADHGVDPTYKGTDHTREHIPVLVYGKKLRSVQLGVRDTYSDIAKTISAYYELDNAFPGKSFLPELTD